VRYDRYIIGRKLAACIFHFITPCFFPVGKSMKPQCLVMDYFVTGWFETIF
jgi:hypothetical protein